MAYIGLGSIYYVLYGKLEKSDNSKSVKGIFHNAKGWHSSEEIIYHQLKGAKETFDSKQKCQKFLIRQLFLI